MSRVLIVLIAIVLATAVRAEYPPVTCKGVTLYEVARPKALPDSTSRQTDVLHYDLDLRIDPGTATIAGSVTIDFVFLTETTDRSMKFDLVTDLEVLDVTWDGESIPFLHEDDVVSLYKTVVPATRRDARIRITYEGQPQRHGELNMGLVTRDRGTSPEDIVGPVVFNISEPSSSHSWWPCKDHPSDKATARIAMTVPDTLQAVANGLLVLEEAVEPGWRRFVWETSYPMATYLLGISVSEFIETHEDCPCQGGNVPLTWHIFPENAAVADTFFAPTCDMLRFLEDLAGPYPFADERYGQMQIKWGGAMEHQTSTSFGTPLIRADGKYANAIVHELAHQWFGNLLTPSAWHDIWLNEGFARYTEALWYEHTRGRDAYLAYLNAIGPVRHPDLFAEAGILSDPHPILRLMVYDKGAWVLHMLRGALGDETFFRFLHDYATDPTYAYGNVTTADMLLALDRAAGRDMNPWILPWLETNSAPHLVWSWRTTPASNGGDRVHVEIEQVQSQLFHLRVPIHVITNNDTLRTSIELTDCTGRLDVDTYSPVSTVLLDPEGWILGTQERIEAPMLSLLPTHPNPVGGDGAVIHYRLENTAQVELSLYDVRGRLRGRWDFGERPADVVHDWLWRGNDDTGRPLPDGAYWITLKAGSQQQTESLVLLR